MRMRHLLIFFAGLLLLVPELPAKASEDWNRVEQVRWDSVVRVELWNGSEYVGRFAAADSDHLRIKLWQNRPSGQTAEGLTLPREQVRLLETVSDRDPDLANYQRIGMAGGGVVGATGLGLAVRHSAWPAGALFGGLIGVAVGGALGGTAALVAHASAHHHKVVYESHQAPPNEVNP